MDQDPVFRSSRLYEQPEFRAVSGLALRPGGEALTRRGLALCGFSFPMDGAALPAALDMGCGAGATVGLLAALGFRVTGVDPSPDLLTEAVRAVAGLPAPPPRFLPGRAESLPVDDASRDLLICECVLSLLPDADAALAEAARVLKPGGALLLADVYDRLGGPASVDRSGDGCSCLAGARSAPALRALLERHGFRVLAEEDHSRALAELAARLVFGGGSLAGLARWLGADCAAASSGRDLVRRFGYILMAARKVGFRPDKHKASAV